MKKQDGQKILKLALANYLCLLAVYGFNLASSMTVVYSAVLVILLGPTRKECVAYCKKRVLAQLIGISIGIVICAAFTLNLMEWLPPSQRYTLPSTLGLAAVLIMKAVFHWNISDITLLTPVFMVMMMTPSNPRYPVQRFLYCLLGIVIGVVVNCLVFPCPPESPEEQVRQ